MVLKEETGVKFSAFLREIEKKGMVIALGTASVSGNSLLTEIVVLKGGVPVGSLQIIFDSDPYKVTVCGSMLPNPGARPTLQELQESEFTAAWLRVGLDAESIE